MITLLISTAFAQSAPCSWTAPLNVTTTVKTVTVNGHTYDVRASHDKEAFSQDLLACKVDPLTLRKFLSWRQMRVLTNCTIVPGLLIPPWVLVAAPVGFAVEATAYRHQFENRMRTWTAP